MCCCVLKMKDFILCEYRSDKLTSMEVWLLTEPIKLAVGDEKKYGYFIENIVYIF